MQSAHPRATKILGYAVYASGLVLGMALITLGAVRSYRFLHPEYQEVGTIEGACDLHHSPCSAVLPDGARLVFALSPRPIRLVTPLEIEVRLEGVKARSVEVDFSSREMNMGFNRPVLAAAGGDVFRGRTILPACVSERMTWRALVLLHTHGGTLGVPFSFVTSSTRSTT